MSLTVNSYSLTPDGNMEDIYPPRIQFWLEPGFNELTPEQQRQRWREANPNPGSDSAGFESYRWKVWGSETVCSLGCALLPTLNGNDIYATGEQIEQLEREVSILKANIAFVSEQTSCEARSLEQDIQNMADAIERAKSIGGGVVIW